MLAIEEAAQGFSAVGSEQRLSVLLTLIRATPEGLAIGQIQERLKIPASTLTHHLRFLAVAKLVVQEKRGREVITRANYDRLKSLADYLLEECCQDHR